MKILLLAAGLLLFISIPSASAQRGTCGDRCLYNMNQSSCVSCALGFGHPEKTAQRWCRRMIASCRKAR